MMNTVMTGVDGGGGGGEDSIVVEGPRRETCEGDRAVKLDPGSGSRSNFGYSNADSGTSYPAGAIW